jgi:hypothetical protein
VIDNNVCSVPLYQIVALVLRAHTSGRLDLPLQEDQKQLVGELLTAILSPREKPLIKHVHKLLFSLIAYRILGKGRMNCIAEIWILLTSITPTGAFNPDSTICTRCARFQRCTQIVLAHQTFLYGGGNKFQYIHPL